MGRKRQKPEKLRTFGDWYGENREDTLDKKRIKYQNDPEYRAKTIKATKKRYQERKGINEDGSREVTREGKTYSVFKLSLVANNLGVDPTVLRSYFSKGYLPTWFYDGSNLRYITTWQVPIVTKFVKLCKDKQPSLVVKLMKDTINNNWDKENGSFKK